jgi:hypothetical protein
VTITGYKDSHNYTLTRRFNDIQWLHENLLKANPGCKLPVPPEKNIWLKLVVGGKTQIEERIRLIETYLNELANHKVLRKDDSFRKFTFDEFIGNETSKQLIDKIGGLMGRSKQDALLPGLNNIDGNPYLEKERYLMVKLYHCLIKVKGLIESLVLNFNIE